MATSSYSGSWSGALGLNALRTCNLSGGGGASGVINSVVANLIFSTNAYSPTYNLSLTLNFSGGGSKSISDSVKLTADDYTSASRSFTFSGLTVEQANSISSISVQCTGASGSGQAKNVYVKSSVTVTVNYTVPSKVSKPTISVSSTKTTGSSVTVSWTASSSGTANTLTGYDLQYADSSNGSSFGSWTTYGSYGTGTRSVSASLPAAKGWRKFRVRAKGSAGSDYYSDWSESSAVVHVATPSAPGNFKATQTTWESGNVALSWDASSVTGSSISRYYIEYRLKQYGGSYGNWTALANTTNTSYSYNPGLSKGDNIDYRVRAYSSDEIYSSYSSTVTVVRETEKPINLTPAAGWYTEIGLCSWELPAAIDLTGTVSQYRYTTDSGANWSSWTNATGKSFNAASAFANVTSGAYFQYQVRAHQTNGDNTDAATSAALYKNAAPSAPVILMPVPASPTSPGAFWALLSVSTDPNGHAMTVSYTKDGGERVTIASDLTAACVVAVKLNTGGVYAFRVTDQYGAYSETTKTITVVAETYTDNPVTAGTTRIKAAHINELRSRVEQLCALYGVTAPTWEEDVIAGTTSIRGFPDHITELREAIEALYAAINAQRDEAVIAPPSWATTLTDIKPKAAAIEELRAAARAI